MPKTLRKDHKMYLEKPMSFQEADHIIVSFSGGKDSIAMVLHLLDNKVDREKIILWHQSVDGKPGGGESCLMDWPVTESYCQAVADALGVQIRFQWRTGGIEKEMYRKAGEPTGIVKFQSVKGELITAKNGVVKLNRNRTWPLKGGIESGRWCTPMVKIDVSRKAINNDPDLQGKKILFLTGERRQESARRATYAEWEKHPCSGGKGRMVHQHRIIIDWKEEQNWEIMKRYGIDPHPAYKLGWSRLSCMTCIFGSCDQWASIAHVDPERFDRVHEHERVQGHTIDGKLSVKEQKEKGALHPVLDSDDDRVRRWREQSLERIYAGKIMVNGWELPAGAFKDSGGPS